MARVLWFMLTVFITWSTCDGYKLLLIFPVPAKSHAILGEGYVRHLLDAGHEVTYVTPFPIKNASKNLRQIDISSNDNPVNVTSILNKEVDMGDPTFLLRTLIKLAVDALEHKDVQKVLQDPNEQFDLLITENLLQELVAGVAIIFDCPFIWAMPADVHWTTLQLIDEAPNPAYTVDLMSVYLPPFTFLQRVEELWMQLQVILVKYMYFDAIERKEFDRIITPLAVKRGRKPVAYDDIRYNASMVLGNSHPSIGQAIRLPQNYKGIGGFHIDENVKPLPEDLQKIMDSSKNGVIYFSMGSNLKSKDFPEELRTALLKVFRGLKQTVLWKFEEQLPDAPKNVHILKWAPQQSILAHPNCVLFITHGGLLSTLEAVHFGVPLVGIPVFADQFTNVARAVSRGFAKKVDMSENMAAELKTAVDEVLGNPRYTEVVKELSFIYHDRPVSPGKELVHWVQHVVRTRGAVHLRSPALHVPLYQKLYLDLAAVVIAILVVVAIILRRLINVIFKKRNNKKKIN